MQQTAKLTLPKVPDYLRHKRLAVKILRTLYGGDNFNLADINRLARMLKDDELKHKGLNK